MTVVLLGSIALGCGNHFFYSTGTKVYREFRLQGSVLFQGSSLGKGVLFRICLARVQFV